MRFGVRLVRVACVGAIVVTGTAQAQTEPCAGAGRPWVELSGSSTDLAEFESLLRAELAPRYVDVCHDVDKPVTPAIATVTVTRHADSASIVVEAREGSTFKRVSRDLDLTGVPEDGRSFTLAVVADELLRASWGDLALTAVPTPAPASPALVPPREAVTPGATERSWVSWSGIEAVAASEHWAGSATFYGADLRLAVGTASRFGAAVRFGAREAPSVLAADGQVRTSALIGGVSASFRATPLSDRYGLDAIARIDAVRVFYVAVPNPGAGGTDRADTAILVGAGMDGWIGFSRAVRVVAEVLVDAPLRAVSAGDGDRQVVAVSGAGIEAGLGVRLAF